MKISQSARAVVVLLRERVRNKGTVQGVAGEIGGVSEVKSRAKQGRDGCWYQSSRNSNDCDLSGRVRLLHDMDTHHGKLSLFFFIYLTSSPNVLISNFHCTSPLALSGRE